jgi:hypothetical protein
MTREPIFAALFSKIQTVQGVTTFSRVLKHWNDCDPSEQPAIYMAQGNQFASHQSKDTPYKWDLSVNLYVYVRTSDGIAPATVLNPILDQAESVLTPMHGMKQTLGGLCDACYIDGEIQTYEGTLGQQEVAIIPIKILVR